MSFHFQPVSFSLEASPCRSPCPLATDVLSEKEEWSCFVDSFLQCAIFFSSPPFSLHSFLFFLFFTLNWAAKKDRKKGVKKNQQRGSIRSNSVYEVFFKAFEEKHLSGGGMRPNCSQSLLILPVQSPCRARAGGRRGVPRLGRGGGYRHLALTLCLCSCPLKVGLFSLSHSEAQFRATI